MKLPSGPAIGLPVAPSNDRTCGPPPAPAPVTMSARPSPFRSPDATYTPPVKPAAYGMNWRTVAPDVPSSTTTNGEPAPPEPSTMSAMPSPLTSPAATCRPQLHAGVPAEYSRTSAPVVPLNARATKGDAQPPVTITSAMPSPVTSPAATSTPPVNAGSNAKNEAIAAPVAPLYAITCGPPPGPAPVMTSSTPSPLTSPCATETPPVKPGAYA